MNSLLNLSKHFWLMFFVFSAAMTFAQEKKDVSFSILEDIPKFQNCIEVSNEKAKDCFNQEMANHIMNNFNYPKKARRKKIQGKVNIMFVIDIKGFVTNIKTHAPADCELLEAEAIRIVKLLPKFKPGMQRGKPVSVSYAIPINFKLD